jgi:hypothetical protein
MITSLSNVEGTNDLTNSSRGSGTPPWLHHAGPTMASRAWPKPSPRQLKDLQWPSASFWYFSFVSAALWWMDGSGGCRRHRQYIEEHLGQRASWTELGTGQAGRPRPIGPGPFWLVSAPFCSLTLLGQLLTCSLLHVGPWHHLLHGLDRAPCRASFNIFCSGPWSFTTSCFGPWAIWSHVHHVSWLVPGFMIFSWSALWTYPESLLFNVSFLRKQ